MPSQSTLALAITIQLKRKNKSWENHHHRRHWISCHTFTFPVDCKVGDWKPWGACTVTCGNGTKTRRREIILGPKNGGVSCPALKETVACEMPKCPGTFPYSFFYSIITSSWLQSWQLESLGWMQCELRGWKQDENTEGHPRRKAWRRDVSISGGNRKVQDCQMQRYPLLSLFPNSYVSQSGCESMDMFKDNIF